VGTRNDLVDRFRFPQPTPDQAAAMEHIRTAALHLAYELRDVLPACRETEQALTALEEVFLWAVAAITRTKAGKGTPADPQDFER